jgi:hypothetical protein
LITTFNTEYLPKWSTERESKATEAQLVMDDLPNSVGEIPATDVLVKDTKLGSGGFAKVYSGVMVSSGELLAIKKLSRDPLRYPYCSDKVGASNHPLLSNFYQN